ncbi:MAG TPA: trypsin-like peptidase domain-containing protein [Planctomycetaceae bacterium]|jgi:S1-C subfamily serine protease
MPKRKSRVLYIFFGVIAVLSSGLAIRLWITYLLARADNLTSLDNNVGQTVSTIPHAPGDLPALEERIRRTAQAVLPSVVAVKNPFAKPSESERYQKNYASGVIITADGIVLSEWHVSHWKDSENGDGTIRAESSPSGSAGDKTTVILHDGRECPAELLGANRSHDVSLLRLLEPGPYPHVPLSPTAPITVGDWVLKVGHPLGYRKGRPALVRLGRVICGTQEFFGADYPWAGGDSGGPCFSLDGQLLGINGSGGGTLVRMQLHEARIHRHAGGWRLSGVTGSQLIDSLLDSMRRGEVSPYDMQDSARRDRELATGAPLPAADYSDGSATLARYRPIVEPTRSSVVVVLNEGVAVSLGTIVGAAGWVLTKASVLSDQPTCRLADGKVVSARVAGVDVAFDLALLSIPATDLHPASWADDFNPPVGTLLAAVGTERPLAIGVVSVPRRDLEEPLPPADTLPLRIAAGRPEIYGSAQPIGGYSLRAAIGQPRSTVYQVGRVFGLAWSAGVRPGDLLHHIDGRRIAGDADMLAAVNRRRTGDVVPIRLERAGQMLDLRLPLAPETRYIEINYRSDDFPTVIECAVPFYSYECGGPIVDLTGRALGVTIARPGPHGGLVIPGDCILKLLPDLQAGRLAGNWSPGQ